MNDLLSWQQALVRCNFHFLLSLLIALVLAFSFLSICLSIIMIRIW